MINETEKIVGKFYSVHKASMSNENGLKVTIDLGKLINLYGPSVMMAQIFIPVESSVDMDNIPEVDELTLDDVPTKLTLKFDDAPRHNAFEPKVVKIGDSIELVD